MTPMEAAARIVELEQQRYVISDVCSNHQAQGFIRAMREISAEQHALFSMPGVQGAFTAELGESA